MTPPSQSPTAADACPPWGSYAAVGDSFTEGLWDGPAEGPLRGWADQLAGHLSARRVDAGAEPLRYANLAVRGRLLNSIIDDQLDRALTLGPDLVSIAGGGNDILRPAVDVDALAQRFEDAVVRAKAAGAAVLIATAMDSKGSPIVQSTRGRAGILNTYLWSIARRHDVSILDLWGMRSLRDWRMWSADRIHLTPEGHTRVAYAALEALGQPTADGYDDRLAPLPPSPRIDRLREDWQWAREWAIPWATRRLRRRSSGDARVAKRPELTPVSPLEP